MSKTGESRWFSCCVASLNINYKLMSISLRCVSFVLSFTEPCRVDLKIAKEINLCRSTHHKQPKFRENLHSWTKQKAVHHYSVDFNSVRGRRSLTVFGRSEKVSPWCPNTLPFICCLANSASWLRPNQSAHCRTALPRWERAFFSSMVICEKGRSDSSGTKMLSQPKPWPGSGATMRPWHSPVNSTGSACFPGENARVHTAVADLSG